MSNKILNMKKEINVTSWEECEAIIKTLKSADTSLEGLWFRSHQDSSWPLTSTLERRIIKPMTVLQYYHLVTIIKAEIETFTKTDWSKPDFSEILDHVDKPDFFRNAPLGYEYLTHLRHHGFPSPLLDWTGSPYIAAYFAFAKTRANSVAIFVYSEMPENMKTGSKDEAGIFTFGPIVKTHKRHFRQQSRYSVCAQYETDQWIYRPHQSVFDLGNKNQDLLWKITIPSSERIKVLKHLDQYNLNEFSLFDSEEGLMETLAFREIDAEGF